VIKVNLLLQYLSLPPLIAPVKCSVLPLSNKADLLTRVAEVVQELRKNEVSVKVDDSSGSIGRRYARTDEIAIPFGITIDFETLNSSTVTLRERDSTLQVRLPVTFIFFPFFIFILQNAISKCNKKFLCFID